MAMALAAHGGARLGGADPGALLRDAELDAEDDLLRTLDRQRSVRFDVAEEAESEAESEDSDSSTSDEDDSEDDDDDYSSTASFVVNEDIFKTPVDQPDLLEWQFRIAMDKRDPDFLEKILELENEHLSNGDTEYEISAMEKAKYLALAMLSNQESLVEVLCQYMTVVLADDWFSNTHPASRCDCEDGHRGSLLVRLVRAGNYDMVIRCLQSGMDANASICDGDMRRMFWNSDSPESKREGSKLEAVFQKGTALTAAAAIGDTRLLELLLNHGANIEAHDFAVFAVAARFGQIDFLQSLLSNECFDEFPKMHRACVVALKSASIEGQEATIDWLLKRLQQFDDWEVRPVPRKKSAATMSLKLPRGSGSWGSLGSLRRRHKSTGSLVSRPVSGSGNSQTKQLVGEALSNTLDELIKDGQEPGTVMRHSLTKGIENVVQLQRKHLPVFDFDPRKLLAFYVSAAEDDSIFISEEVAIRLLDLGLSDYLLGDQSPLANHDKEYQATSMSATETALAVTATKVPGLGDRPISGRPISGRPISGRPPTSPTGATTLSHFGGSYRDMRRSRAGPSLSISSTNPAAELPTPEPMSSQTDDIPGVPPQRGFLGASRPKIRSIQLVTTRMLSKMLSTISTQGGLSGHMSSRHTGRVATDKERRSAVLSAAQVGHRSVLAKLMNLCTDSMLQTVVVQATRYGQKETVLFLLEEAARRKRRDLDSSSFRTDDFALENPAFLDTELLSNVLMAALSAGDAEIADLALEKGAFLSSEQVTQTLESIIRSNSKLACKGIAKTMDLALDTDFGASELSHLVDVTLENQKITNLRALKAILIRSKLHFVRLRHLVQFVHRSCGRSNEDSWRVVAELLIKNMQRSDNPEQANKDLTALLLEAETLPQVHVGVLTLLMHSCETEPEHPPTEEQANSEEGDGHPSRWL